VDMVFKIIPKTGKGGRLHEWQNGRQVVDYQGALGFKDDENEIVFKLGLYRDAMDRPMRIVYDRFRRGKTDKKLAFPTR
jgi:hypothetical protein